MMLNVNLAKRNHDPLSHRWERVGREGRRKERCGLNISGTCLP
jgi:hypothetical protein